MLANVQKLTQLLLQVLINYGRKSNEQLLLYYGFSMRDNAADSVVLTLPQAQVHSKRASERASERELPMFMQHVLLALT